MSNTRNNKTLENLKKNPDLLLPYFEALGLLKQSGVLNVLEEAARPTIVELGANLNIQATEAARSAGYFECLNHLQHFDEIFLSERHSLEDVPLEYGAGHKVLEDGDLTEEELHARRRGEVPEYKPIRATIPKPDGTK